MRGGGVAMSRNELILQHDYRCHDDVAWALLARATRGLERI